jgi:small-conductance mechanosensitive channel
MTRLLAIGVCCIIMGLTAPAQSQVPGAVPDSIVATVAQPDTATLLVGNRAIATFRSSFGAQTAVERVERAAARINALAEAGSMDTITLLRIPQGILVRVGRQGVFSITPADVDSNAAQSLEQVAADAMLALRVAMAEEREARSFIQILTGIALAALATVVFILLARLLQRARVIVMRRMLEVAHARAERVAILGFTIFSREQVVLFLRRVWELFIWALVLFAAYLWLTFVLTRFAYSRPWGEALGTYLMTTLSGLVLGAIAAVPGLFTVVLIFLAARFLARLITAFFNAAEGGEVSLPWLHTETIQPTRQLIIGLVWLFAVIIAYPFLPGAGTDVFKGVSVFVGLVLSLGSTGLVNQAMGGLVLMYARALKPGEYVSVSNVEGTVETVGMLSTKIRTPKNEIVTIPNAVMISNTTKNFSRLHAAEGVIVYTSITIGYDVPWRQVQGLLLLAASRTPGLRDEPAPFVRQTALGDFYIEYQLNAFLEEPHMRIAVLSELHAQIVDAFNEYGVQITSPHYIADPPQPFVVPRDRWYAAPAPSKAAGDGAGEPTT